ncbi:MAG: rhodanese-like domain-containing protein [Haloferacaceae archaeon]
MAAETTPAELAELLENGDVTVLDVRDAHAYRQGHIPGVESLPLTEMDDSILDREWPPEVVLVDYRGEAAPGAAEKIDDRIDSRVTALAGGMAAWDGDLEADF